jgi:hypothetical protein
MSVTVIGTDAATQDGVEHGNGIDIAVQDGHLIVVSRGPQTIAIYAPGSWTRAEVTKR